MATRGAVEELPLDEVVAQPSWLSRAARTSWWFARKKPLGAFGAVVIIILLFTAAFADAWLLGSTDALLAPHRFDEQFISARAQGPSLDYPFGTDRTGHDLLSQIIYGARVSVIIGFTSVAIAAFFSGLIGIISGYYGGTLDSLVQRLVDIVIALPALVLLIVLISVFAPAGTDRGTEIWRGAAIILGLGIVIAAASSRVIRGSTLSIKENQYVEAAKAIGASDLRILLRYILPNVAAVILILASIQVGTAIIAEASISFLGYGIPDPFPSWGRMVSEGTTLIRANPWYSIWPGLAITITVYAFNMFGDALRDVLDPRLRGSF